MTMLAQIQSRKRKALAVSVISGMLVFAALLAIGLVSVPWGIIFGFYIYFRLTRTDKFVVWLRRFHRSEPKRLRFNMLLNRACSGLCIPITIQDSVFKTSYFSSGSRLLLIFPLIFGLGTLLYLLCAVTIGILLLKLGLSDNATIVLGLVFALGAVVFYGYTVKNYLARRGYVTLDAQLAKKKANEALRKITERKAAFQGVMILKCADEVWQDVVRLILAKANAVLIDVSDLTENLMWELDTAFGTCSQESIIITCGVGANAPEELPPEVREKLEIIIGGEGMSRMRVFYYPAEQPRPGPARGRLYTSLSKKLVTELAGCIEESLA